MSALTIAVTKLGTTGAVTAITGTTGIHAMDAPQGATAPYVIVNIIAGRDEHMLTGGAGYFYHRISVECLAATPLAVMNLGNAVMTALQDNVNATIGAFTGVCTQFADTDITMAADDRALKKRTLDFWVRWRN